VWLRHPSSDAGSHELKALVTAFATRYAAFDPTVDPKAAQQARERYSCFDHFGEDTQAYGLMTRLNISKSCEEEVVSQLVELQRRAADYARRDGPIVDDDFFYAEQNARLVKNAEAYYRSMFLEEVSSWNLRDRHMAETLEALVQHLGRNGARAKVAVWEHNSHLGDAQATDMSRRGELNVGQLTREKYNHDAVLVGFTTYHGSVTAASDWESRPSANACDQRSPAATKRSSMPRCSAVSWSFGTRATC